MKTTAGKNSIQKQSRKLIAKFTLPLFVLSISLSTSVTKAGGSDAFRKSKNQVQNVSGDISQCEQWYALVSNSSNATPWHDILHSGNQGYLAALLAAGGAPDGTVKTLPIFNKIAQIYYNDPLDKNKLSFANLNKIITKLPTCEAYVAATNENNYTIESGKEMGIGGNSKKEGSDAVNTQMLQCMSQANQKAQQQCMQQAMQTGNMKCQHDSFETHDYLSCKQLATFVMGFAVGKSAMQLQQGFRAGNSNIDAQAQLMQKQNTKAGIGMADTLGVQRDSLKQQGEMAYEMAAYNATKAGILLKMISDFPTREKMFDKCKENLRLQQTIYHNALEEKAWFLEYTQGATPKDSYNAPAIYGGNSGGNDPIETLCDTTLLNNPSDMFFENQEILDKVKQMAMQAGLEAVANGAQGALLNKQAGIVNDAIGDIKKFEKPNFQQAGSGPSLASECSVNPNAKGCITLGGATTSGFGSQSFGATGSGSANLGSATLGTTNSSGNNSSSRTKRNLLPSSVGSVQIGQGNKGGFSDAKVAAGSIKPGQGGAGGGGSSGGGSGAGGAALPAGGGGANRGGGNPRTSGSGKSAITVGLNGSGMGRVSGGRGAIGRKSKSSSANPFAKLLGKSKRSGSTLSFRGPASQIGKSRGSLFKRISSRYKAVADADKLLKYKATNSK